MTPSVPLSQKIVVLREVNNMTQNQLAERLGVSRSLVGFWETGRSRPNAAQIRQLADIFIHADQDTLSLDLLPDRRDAATHLEQLVDILRADESRPESQRAAEYAGTDLQDLVEKVLEGGEAIGDQLSNVLRWGAFSRAVQEVKPITYHQEERVYEAVGEHHPLDEYAHVQFLALIKRAFFADQNRPGLVLFSEQAIDPEGVIKPVYLYPEGRSDPAEIREYIILDPLDRTAEAVRGIAGFSNLTYGSFEHGPLFSVVFLLFDRTISCYYAITGQGAWVRFHDGTKQVIAPATTNDLRHACVAAYVGRSGRLRSLAACETLIAHHQDESSFVNASGCYGFCLVAASQVDAFVEVAKGYRWHDIVSGAHILREAGGMVRDLAFDDLRDPLSPRWLDSSPESTHARLDAMSQAWAKVADPDPEQAPANGSPKVGRQRFIAAATPNLAAKIAIALAQES